MTVSTPVARPLATLRQCLLLVLACLALHALTLTRFPAVWLDEAIFTDPAVGLAWTGRLSSTAWYFQDDQAFWAANVPLYPVLLAGWIELFGLTVAGVRSLNLVLAGLAALVLLHVVRQRAWLSARWSGWLAVLLLCGYGMVLAHRGTRYDALGLLLCAVLLWATGLPAVRRWPLMLGAGALIPWAGLHVAVYVGLMAIGWCLWAWARPWREVLAILLGLALGLASLGAFLHAQGALDAFLLNVRLSGYAGKKDGPRDPSLVLLLIALGALATSVAGRAALRHSAAALGWIAAGTVVPTVIYLAARFPVYYAWMAVVPLALGLAMVVDGSPATVSEGPRHRVVAWCLWAAVAAGLPVQTAITLGVWQQRDPAALEAFAARAGLAGQVVLVDPELFYPARKFAAKAYFSMYDFGLTERGRTQRADVALMLVSPDTQPALARQLGGVWQAGELFEALPPPPYRWLAQRVSHSLFGGYRLQVFRRVANTG